MGRCDYPPVASHVNETATAIAVGIIADSKKVQLLYCGSQDRSGQSAAGCCHRKPQRFFTEVAGRAALLA